MKKVTGLGGIFLKAKDPKALAKWYQQHLGLEFGDGSYISFQQDPATPAETVFSFFENDSKYFAPSTRPFMINFRVSNLYGLLADLRSAGVWVDEKVEEYSYGKFGWCTDMEGNKIELWEPLG